MSTTTAMSEPTTETTEALYVYGIVPADTVVDDLADTGLGGQPRLVTAGEVAAVVEAVDAERPLGRRRDLLAHSGVLNALALRGPVLPIRFGSVVRDEDAVIGELLLPQEEHFGSMLVQVAGKVQFTLRARYLLDTVLAEVVAQEPDVAELRRRTAGLPEEAAHYDRIRLGELVSRAVDVRREEDTRHVLDALAAHADEHVVREVAGMDDLAEISFLVASDAQAGFEQAAEALAEEMHERAQMSLAGPMALYDFIPEQ